VEILNNICVYFLCVRKYQNDITKHICIPIKCSTSEIEVLDITETRLNYCLSGWFAFGRAPSRNVCSCTM